MIPLQKVKSIIDTYQTLEKELSSQEIDKKTFAEKSKEYSNLNEIIKEATLYFNFQKNKNEFKNIRERLIEISNKLGISVTDFKKLVSDASNTGAGLVIVVVVSAIMLLPLICSLFHTFFLHPY